jgi:hypothetical protein
MICRQTIEHRLAFCAVGYAYAEACGSQVIFLLQNAGGLTRAERREQGP